MKRHSADAFYDVEAVGIPAAFSIVWCRFPLDERPDEPGRTLRPCLVRASYTAEAMFDGRRRVIGLIDTVYGTKQVDKFPPPGGFHIDREEDKRELGLIHDTVFNLDKVLRLAWTKTYFGPGKSGALFDARLNRRLREALRAQWLDHIGRQR